MSDTDMSYGGRDKCGCLVAAVVDVPEHAKDTAKTLAEWVRDGLTIERMTVAEVRADPTWFRCPHEQETATERPQAEALF